VTTGYSEDELYADLLEVIEQMVEAGELELATRKDQDALAARLTGQVRGTRHEGLADWFVEQRGVSELYLDDDELARRFAKVFARLAGDEPTAQWNEELAARIREAPGDVSARVVFGDWLEQAGDPRGELVQLQARLAATPDDATLRRREQRFVTRHRGYLLGPLADDEDTRVTFAYGFVDTLATHASSFADARALPSLAFLRELRLHGTASELTEAATHLPPRLSALGLRCTTAEPLAVATLVRDPTALVTLEVAARPVVLGNAAFPALRVLDARDPEIATAEVWARAFPQLEEVRLALNAERSVPPTIARLFDAPPPRLVRLRITGTWTARAVVQLFGTPLLAQLVELDVDGARFDVEDLERRARELAHLQRLDLRGTNVYHLPGLEEILVTGSRPGQTFDRDRYADVYDEDEDEDEDDEEDTDEDEDDEPETDEASADAEADEDDDGAPPELEFDD